MCASNVKGETLAIFYRQVSQAVTDEAHRLYHSSNDDDWPDDEKAAGLLHEGVKYFLAHGFQPLGSMIDKNTAGLKAITEGEAALPLIDPAHRQLTGRSL